MDIIYKTPRGEKTYIISTFDYSFSTDSVDSIRSNVSTDRPIDGFLLQMVRDNETVEAVVRFPQYIDGKIEENEVLLKGVRICAISSNASGGQGGDAIRSYSTLSLTAKSLSIGGIEVQLKEAPSGGPSSQGHTVFSL